MPSKKLSEYQIKTLWNKFNNYPKSGWFINKNNLDIELNKRNNLVVKVDDGSKRRMKRGLVKLNQNLDSIKKWVVDRNEENNYFIEEMQNIEEEIYVMIRVEDTYNCLYVNKTGGIEQLDPLKDAVKIKVDLEDEINVVQFNDDLNQVLNKLYNFFVKYHLTFMEVNPLAKTSNGYHPIDFAVMIDDCSFYLFDKEDRELVEMNYFIENNLSEAEKYIRDLDLQTGGSLKFKLINPNGKVWTMVAGGGASVVYTDAIVNAGYLDELANYGEYSGNPPKELVHKYSRTIFELMSKVSDEKYLFIGGGIANFTDVKKTFAGIIQSIKEYKDSLQNTKIYVRRGGPNYQDALKEIKQVCDDLNIFIEVYGPEMEITKIVTDTLLKREFVKNNIQNITNLDLDSNVNSIDYRFNNTDVCFIYSYQPKAVQRMLDFDYLCNREKPSICAIIDPRKRNSMIKFFWGKEPILIPLINKLSTAMQKFKDVNHVVNFASFRSGFESTDKLLNYEQIKSIAIIAEGIPEQQARLIKKKANNLNKLVLGPATVGGIKPGCLRIGNTGGSLDNIRLSKLYTPGDVAFVTRSGGLLNELCNIVSKRTNGVYQGMSIGGDRHPGSNFLDHIINYQNDENVKLIILLGEVGGVQEILVANAVKNNLITKPIIGWCMGTSADYFKDDIQFGHAGAFANEEFESANFKNKYMKDNGINVPDSFEVLGELISDVYKNLNLDKKEVVEPREFPSERKDVTFFSSISNEIGEELEYNGKKISDVIDGGLGKVIGHLWFKKDLPIWFCKYIELILMITADHGGMVSGAHNTMVASRAGKDLISSLCSGLLTIGDYFGGALNEAGRLFYDAFLNDKPEEFVKKMNKQHKLISGIGHKIKTKDNPDKRVEILFKFVENNFPKYEMVKYAFQVEEITLQKRNNLILNVDGFIACSILDALKESNFMTDEIEEILDNGLLNAFFVLGRSIGFIGHWNDQKRLKQGLFRLNKDDIKYID